MSSCQTSDISCHQLVTSTLQTGKNSFHKTVKEESKCNKSNSDDNKNSNCIEQTMKINGICNSYLNIKSPNLENNEEEQQQQQQEQQQHRADEENCSNSNGVSCSSNDTNHIIDEQRNNKSYELTCAREMESEQHEVKDEINEIHSVRNYIAKVIDETDNSNLCMSKCDTLYSDTQNKYSIVERNGDMDDKNEQCNNKEIDCNNESSTHETDAKIEKSQCTSYGCAVNKKGNEHRKSVTNSNSDKNNDGNGGVDVFTNAESEKQNCTVANTHDNVNNNTNHFVTTVTSNTHVCPENELCETRTKHRTTKNARSSYPLRTPFYSIPLPTCHGSVITLHSLSQLNELIDTQSFLPSKTSIDVHSTELVCANKNACGSLHKPKFHIEPSELHTTLHAGETVVILLHEGNAVLSNVVNSFTHELTQLRIYTLNLEGLPPQDYYEALSLNTNTTTADEISHKRAKVDTNELTSSNQSENNGNNKNEERESDKRSNVNTSSSSVHSNAEKELELQQTQHKSTFDKNTHHNKEEYSQESCNDYNSNNDSRISNINDKSTIIFSSEYVNQSTHNVTLLEELHEQKEEEEEEEEEEMTLITPHKHLSSQCTSMHNSPSLLSPPNASCEIPTVTSHSITAVEIPEPTSHVRSMVEITKRTPIKYAKQENSSSLASAIVSVKEHMVKIINTKLGIELEMELPFSHPLNTSPELPVSSSSELVLGAPLDTFNSYYQHNTSNAINDDINDVNDNAKVSDLPSYTSNHMTSNDSLDTIHNYVEPRETNYESNIDCKHERFLKREHVRQKKVSQTEHEGRKENDRKVHKERQVFETKTIHSSNRENDYNGSDNDNISFKSCAMIIWRAPCAPLEEYAPEPPLIKGEVAPALTPASQSHVQDKHKEHLLSSTRANSKEVSAKGTNLPFHSKTYLDNSVERGSSYNREAVCHDETTCNVNDTKEWFRKHVACDGDALIVEYVRHVDQIHSLAMWQLVYTPIHLLRTIACSLHTKQLCNILEDVSISSLEESFTLLYLGASWCPPCMRFVQTMPELIHDPAMKNVHVTVKADFDLAQPIYKCFNVSIIPTFIIFNNRRLIEAWRKLRFALQKTSWNEECEVLCEELLRKAEIGRLQNSQLSTIITFIEKHCTVLTFDDDFEAAEHLFIN